MGQETDRRDPWGLIVALRLTDMPQPQRRHRAPPAGVVIVS
jgi:hypothetical protein